MLNRHVVKLLPLVAICTVVLIAALEASAQEQGLTLKQVGEQMYGVDLFHPSRDSDLGKYLAKTHAATLMRRFPNAPKDSKLPAYALGPKKLVVAVSVNKLRTFMKYFSKGNYLFHLHFPEVGSMYNLFKGKVGSYAILDGEVSDYIRPSEAGAMLIPVLLDSKESARAEDFFKLATKYRGDYALCPWNLRDRDGLPYCPSDGFHGCTHWFGDLPVGSELVKTYSFPKGKEDPTGTHPNTQRLRKYDTSQLKSPDLVRLIKRVWSVPGHKPLGEILNSGAFHRGEFANPGWAAYTLIGSVGVDRVPVVFYLQDDVTHPIPRNFDLRINER